MAALPQAALAAKRVRNDTGSMIDPGRRVLLFSSIGHALMHMMTAF